MDIIIEAKFNSEQNGACQTDGCTSEVVCADSLYRNNSYDDSEVRNDIYQSNCMDCSVFNESSEDDE